MQTLKPVYMVLATIAAITLIVAVVGWSVTRTDLTARSGQTPGSRGVTATDTSQDPPVDYMRFRAEPLYLPGGGWSGSAPEPIVELLAPGEEEGS